MSKIITFSNLKGGSAKSLDSMMVAWSLSKKYKVCFIDFDPQASSTNVLMLSSKNNFKPKSTLMRAIQNEDLGEAKVNIKPNLDLIASNPDIGKGAYQNWLDENFMSNSKSLKDLHNKEGLFLNKLLNPLKKKYDWLIIDQPPTSSIYLTSAWLASDFVNLNLKSDLGSFNGVKRTLDYAQFVNKNYPAHFMLTGIVISDFHKNNPIDKDIINKVKHSNYGDAVYKTVIPYQTRLYRYSSNGITDNPNNHWDKVAHAYFDNLSNEMINRINKMEAHEK